MDLMYKIQNKTANIGIIGLGYVGLPLGLEFAHKGFNVIGFDVDENKIPILNSGKGYIKHIDEKRIKAAVESGKFSATSDFSRLPEADAIIICVPTPLNEHREPDMTYIEKTAEVISQYLRKGQLISLESTTYPGTTDELLLPMFENAPLLQVKGPKSKGLSRLVGVKNEELAVAGIIEEPVVPKTANGIEKFKVGEDFYLAFSPEREDPNNPNYSTATIPKVVGGITPACLQIAQALYDNVVVKTVPVSSTRAAEATKLTENIYRSVNIALVNELKMVFERMGIDVWEVIDAAATKPFGFHPFYPGPGLGGHCIPIDPFYLTWKAREYELHTKFIELAGEINTYMPYYVVEKATAALNTQKKALNGSKVLILGAAYKKNIDDMRESPSLRLIELFREKGAEVSYSDPYVTKLWKSRKYDYDMASVEPSAKNISSYDLAVISTDHDDFDYELIEKHSKLILDTRNAFGRRGIISEKVVKA